MESSFSDTANPLIALDQPKAAYPTIKQSWGVIGWYLLLTLVVGMPIYALLLYVLHVPKVITASLVTIVLSGTLFFLLLRKASSKEAFNLLFTGQELLWLYILLPVLVLANLIVLSLLKFLYLPDITETSFRELARQPFLAFFMLCVVAPVLEELTFRGIILKGLLRNYSPWKAIGQSALLFGLIHMNPAQIAAAGFIGLLLGWLYYRTRSLWLCIAAHALNNLVALLGATNSSLRDIETAKQLFGSNAGYGLALVISALIMGFILWRIQQTTTPIKEEQAILV